MDGFLILLDHLKRITNSKTELAGGLCHTDY